MNQEIISKNIASLRKQKGWTQKQLADKIAYSDKVVSKWERGESLPDVATLLEIAKLFDMTLDEITVEFDVDGVSDCVVQDCDVDTDDYFSEFSSGRPQLTSSKTKTSGFLRVVVALLLIAVVAGIALPLILYFSGILNQSPYDYTPQEPPPQVEFLYPVVIRNALVAAGWEVVLIEHAPLVTNITGMLATITAVRAEGEYTAVLYVFTTQAGASVGLERFLNVQIIAPGFAQDIVAVLSGI